MTAGTWRDDGKTWATWAEAGVTLPARGGAWAPCECPQPNCVPGRNGPRSLKANRQLGIFRCHRCGYNGRVAEAPEFLGKPSAGRTWRQRGERRPALRDIDPRPPDESGFSKIARWWTEERRLPLAQLVSNPNVVVTRGVRFAEAGGGNVERDAVGFRYLDGDDLLMLKFRTGADKRMTQLPGGTPSLYRLNDWRDAGYVILCEGELDAEAWASVGLLAASVPNGSSDRNMEWMAVCEEALANKGRIYLNLDDDAPGRAMAAEAARRLGRERCWAVVLPAADDGGLCKDANDVLMRCGADGPRRLLECFELAEPLPVAGVRVVSDVADEVLSFHSHGYPGGACVGGSLDALFEFFPGQVTVFTGHFGHGKSNFIDNMAARLAVKDGWRFAVFSPETESFSHHACRLAGILTGEPIAPPNSRYNRSPVQTPRVRLEACLSFLGERFFDIRPPAGEATVERVLALAEISVRRHGVNALVIDHWKKFSVPHGHEYHRHAGHVMNSLCEFARRTDVAVFLVAHPVSKALVRHVRDMAFAGGDADWNTKAPVTDLSQVAESGDFANMADNGVSVHRVFAAADADAGPDARADAYTLVSVIKWKKPYGGRVGSARMRFLKGSNRVMPEEGRDPFPARGDWLDAFPAPDGSTLHEFHAALHGRRLDLAFERRMHGSH